MQINVKQTFVIFGLVVASIGYAAQEPLVLFAALGVVLLITMLGVGRTVIVADLAIAMKLSEDRWTNDFLALNAECERRVEGVWDKARTEYAAQQAKWEEWGNGVEAKALAKAARDTSKYDAGVRDTLDAYAFIATNFKQRPTYERSGKRTLKVGYMNAGMFMPIFVVSRAKMTALVTLPILTPAPPVYQQAEPQVPEWAQ